MHGGGYIVGVERDDARCIEFAEYIGCTVVSVGYRLAPESTYRDSVADSFNALKWMVANAAELGIDGSRVAIGGGSRRRPGAGLALYNRGKQGPALAFQLLIYRCLTTGMRPLPRDEVTHPTIWNRDVSFKAWKMYLGDEYGGDAVSPYAAAARQDLSGLPPALVTVGEMDCFAMRISTMRSA